MQSEFLLLVVVAALLAALIALGVWIGRGRRLPAMAGLARSLAAGIAAHAALVTFYLALGVTQFRGKCQPVLAAAQDCSMSEYLTGVGMLTAAGTAYLLPVFAGAVFVSIRLAANR